MARSLILEPNVLLLDEPLGALDARVRRRLREELRAMQRRLGLTFLCVTHDQEDALVVSDYVVVMNAGRVEQWGTPARIYHDPVSSFVADFLGDCNLLRGEVVSLDGIGRGVRVDGLDGTVVRAPRGLKLSAPGTAVMIALRPEAFRLCAPTTGRVDATVLDRIFVGIATQLLLRVGGHRLKAVIPGGGSATSGEVIGLDFDDSSVSVLVSTTEPNPDPSPEANPESDTASVLGSAPDGNAS
jgi:ABC-type Fe3+/spermidine/putrescine transport system ATPase subunit